MPVLSGIELAKKFKEIRHEIPIILCSGYNEKITEEEIRNIGVSGFAMKPIAKTELITLIRKVLNNKE